MEYCEDGSLENLIESRKRLEESESIALFFQIVKGMQVLNVNKVIHRDLKPPNILLKNGIAKIADFGLAKNIISRDLTETFAGSPLQMAPEIMKGLPYSDKVDVYSLGTILYEMLFGTLPF
jgi:serine/threonine protein kinase